MSDAHYEAPKPPAFYGEGLPKFDDPLFRNIYGQDCITAAETVLAQHIVGEPDVAWTDVFRFVESDLNCRGIGLDEIVLGPMVGVLSMRALELVKAMRESADRLTPEAFITGGTNE